MPKKHSLVIIASSMILFSAASANTDSLCKSGEFAVLSGKVGTLKGGAFTGSKILSLCGVGKAPSFSRLTYRFGTESKIELEYSTPENGEMYATNEAIMPRAAVDVIYFSRGQTTYGISQCLGGNCDRSDSIELRVFNGKKQVAKLVSDPKNFKINLDISDVKATGLKQKDTELTFVD